MVGQAANRSNYSCNSVRDDPPVALLQLRTCPHTLRLGNSTALTPGSRSTNWPVDSICAIRFGHVAERRRCGEAGDPRCGSAGGRTDGGDRRNRLLRSRRRPRSPRITKRTPANAAAQVYWRIVKLATAPATTCDRIGRQRANQSARQRSDREIHSDLQADEVLQLTDPLARAQPPLSLSKETRCDTKPACFIFRLRGASLSYIEMVHPLDFVESSLTPLRRRRPSLDDAAIPRTS